MRYLGFVISLLLLAVPAGADELKYIIDHGTVGVIASGSDKARLVIQPSGQCRKVAYSVIADGVLASQGVFDLGEPRSMPLDYTVVTLSCSEKGVKAEVDQVKKSGSLF